ncbi:MAG TPA: efflux RND transporter periplasmic adaptor subunit [Burkholderiales bacterium]|nr:efflux RND transporter periplasmic adaptor subunit [Burkholderiales bacterium]
MIAAVVSLAITRTDSPQYFTAKVERGDVHDVVDSTGTINAVTTVLVGSQISGRIAKLNADFNSVVRKGQVIAEIDPALFEGALLQAEADLKSAQVNVPAARANLEKARALLAQTKADYERATTLAKQDSIAMQAVDLAKATYDAASATVKAAVAAVEQAEAQVSQKAGAVAVARTNLEYTVIRSPIDGTVVARNVDVGQTVAASLQAPTLFTIAQDLTKMQVYAKTDESNVGKVKVGRPVTFKVDAFPKDVFKGVVSQVRMNPVTVQNVVNYDAIIDFENPELKLFPGMTAYVTIPVASADKVLKIPNGALRYVPRLSKAALEELQATPESGGVVWKLGPDNSVEPVRVALGITDHSYTVLVKVLNGELKEGDDLVTGAIASKSRDSGAPPAGSPPRK